jgi:hypothetical protein
LTLARSHAAALLALCCACSSATEAAERKSAAQVARAIELLRQAPNAAKAAPLAQLAKLACQGSEVCATRDACRSAYAMHVEAVTLTSAAKQRLADGRPDEAAKILGAAEQKLADADVKVSACTDREGALRRRYKL